MKLTLPRTLGIALTLTLLAGCATQGAGGKAKVDPDVALGRQQLVDALDAAWIRVVASGKDRQILKTQPASRPGAALSYMVTLADCLPSPDIAPFPEKPVGMFKDILDKGVIRQVTQKTTDTANDTSFYFSTISDLQFQAALDEIRKHYNVNIKVENVELPPVPPPPRPWWWKARRTS